MSLDLPQLLGEVEAMGAALEKRTAALGELLPEARDRLARIGVAGDELLAKIKKIGDHWRGAIPTGEAVDAALPCPPHPPRADVLGADGSQVYPDRHGAALYYVVNVGSILYPHGAERAPTCRSAPQVFYGDEDLYGDSDGMISTALIDGQRDTAELAELARLAEGAAKAPDPAPTVALVDNGLMLWLALQPTNANRREVDEILRRYIDQLGRIQSAGAAVAGFVGRPRNANVLALLHLHSLTLDQINDDTLRASRYRGLTDRALFASVLAPGQRSALFRSASAVNRDFAARGHQMYFFYLHCGRQGKEEIARVEVPQWVALDPERLNLVHAAIVEQCRVPDGFPYVLVRAHELAVVTVEERRALDQMVQGALIRRGLTSAISQKAQTKQWTGARRRRRP